MRSEIGRRQGWWVAFAICLVASAGVAMAQTTPPPPAIDQTTSGAWVGTYGSCAYVLGAYNNPFRNCETAIVDGTGVIPPNCANYSPASGGSQDVLDCQYDALDLDGNGDQDLFYKVYTGCNNSVLTNPDGTYSGQNSLWFGGCSGNATPFSYTVSGVPAGTYRLAVYVMDYDTTTRDQSITVCVGAVCSDAAIVGPYHDGVYQIFYVNLAAGESVKVTHTNVAGANQVAQGVFFDPYAGPMCANGKACSATVQDRLTLGNWTGTYGTSGYVLMNRPVAVKGICQDSSPTYQASAGLTVATTNANSWWWTLGSDYGCGFAAAWIWNCDDATGRALENPGGCGGIGQCAGGYTTSATWDDTGERQGDGPDLMVDVKIDLPGLWRLSFYALDYDNQNRQEVFHLYQYHTLTPLFPPVDIGTYANGKYVTYTLTGPFQATLRVEKTAGPNAIISGIFADPAEGYLCTGQEIPPECSTNAGDFCTYTMGGWGAKYHGGNPGTIRNNYWNTVYPPAVVGDADGDGFGDLVIGTSTGGCKSVTFTDPTAVETFLPCGGIPMAMKHTEVDPTCPKGNSPGKIGLKNTLESQVTALRLNMDYSCAGVLSAKYPNPDSSVCLGDLIITSGPFAGLTVREFYAEAEAALSCGTLDPGFTFADYNWSATAINENFDGCQASNGFLECPPTPPPPGCGIDITKDVSTGHDDINGDNFAPDAYPGDEVSFTLNVEAKTNLSGITVKDVLPSFMVGSVAYDYYLNPGSVTFVPNTGQTWSYDDATNTFTFNLGNLAVGGKVTIQYKARLSLLAPIGSPVTNTATATGTNDTATCSDSHTATVYVVAPVSPNLAGGDVGTPGFWCNHIDQSFHNPFDAAQVNGWFSLIEGASRYWNEIGGELMDNSLPPSFQKALGIICYTGNDAKQKLERHLLVLWLNVASFDVWTDIRLEQLCLSKSFPAGTNLKWTIAEVITFAETALINNDTANFLFWKDICDAINNAAPMVGGGTCNGLTLDPITAFDPRFDGMACDCTPLP